ncbi:patatin-like phospholipase family protein [Microbacter margulisiae]|uniref:NTE family protein n=1 Tax=Microbacter margulisiae TaxID=1350067 RepID=A0A7W5DTE0_9PORP|nr:patatin-like phospholipase family protein [Microbacter margulisiae]MBB3187903.1 NTE family protein [Microbacter margulisiae]
MRKNVTLVLSGGGARGIAHIGVIEEFVSRGYTINSIAGTSMGALVGGVYAVGRLNEFKEWAYTMDKQNALKLIDLSFGGQGLVKGNKVLKAMKTFIPDVNIENLGIKYTATAFDLAHNNEVVFDRGSLYDAIRASIAIPTVFTPVISGSQVLVDGGVSNNIPINNAIRTRRDLLVAVYVNADIPLYKPYLPKAERERQHSVYVQKIAELKQSLFKTDRRDQIRKYNYFNLINSAFVSMSNHLATNIIKNNPPDLLIEISRKSCGLFDFYKAEELVEIGRYATKRTLDSSKH